MSVVILAAGAARACIPIFKVLHTLAGKPMVQHVIDAATKLGAVQVHLVWRPRWRVVKQTPKDDKPNCASGGTVVAQSRHAAGRALL